MEKMKCGDKVRYQGHVATIAAISGLEGLVLLKYKTGTISSWIPIVEVHYDPKLA